MKKIIFISFIILSFSTYGQNIKGKWSGILKTQGIQIRVVFNILENNGSYTATMDSPDQGVYGIPVSDMNFESPVLKLKITSAGIEYEGKLNDKNIIVGNFKQAGQTFPLSLSKEKKQIEKPNRPQEPVKPYPYNFEEVYFENKKDGFVLSGTLTLPKGQNHPAVVLINGSGPQDRNSQVFGHKPFLVLADYLTRKGIAVLRFDDRGVGKSKGDFESATSRDFSTDVIAAVKYLKKRKDIDNKKIGLIGHSEGGVIAPIVANKSRHVNFIVLLAASGISGNELLLLQQDKIGRASGLSEDKLLKMRKANQVAFNLVINSHKKDQLKKDLYIHIKQLLKEESKVNLPEGINEDEIINAQIKKLTSPWMTYFLKYNPRTALKKIKCPVLVLNGEKDLQVPAKENLNAIKEALIEGNNKKFLIKTIPKLNHLFQECESGLPNEYAKIEQTFSPIVLDLITSWIQKQVE